MEIHKKNFFNVSGILHLFEGHSDIVSLPLPSVACPNAFQKWNDCYWAHTFNAFKCKA